MTAVFSLSVIVGIEVDIMKNDHTGWRQIDSQSPSPSGQKKDEYLFIIVEFIN